MKTYIPPISNGSATPGEALLQEARTEGPAFVRSSRGSGRWHIVRSAVDRLDVWRDLEIRTTYHHWCGSVSYSFRALTAEVVPDGEPLCGTCYGRAEGADDRPDLVFEPQGHKPPKTCPGSQTRWVDLREHNRGVCLVCAAGVKMRGFGGAYQWDWGAQKHEPGPGLVDPCEFHGWRQLTLTTDRTVVCRCKTKEARS